MVRIISGTNLQCTVIINIKTIFIISIGQDVLNFMGQSTITMIRNTYMIKSIVIQLSIIIHNLEKLSFYPDIKNITSLPEKKSNFKNSTILISFLSIKSPNYVMLQAFIKIFSLQRILKILLEKTIINLLLLLFINHRKIPYRTINPLKIVIIFYKLKRNPLMMQFY